MQMHINKEYTLVSKIAPTIKGNRVLHDSGVGGIKLVYNVKHFRVYKLFNLRLEGLFPFKETHEVYLRPYKKVWDVSRKRLPKNLWGKKHHPLTSMWVLLVKNYTYQDHKAGKRIVMDSIVTNNELNRRLKNGDEHFKLKL